MTFPSRWFSSLTLLIVAIMVAALLLGYYSYTAASRVAARSEESWESSNKVVGRKLIDSIEKVIIERDQTLFNMVKLDDPREFMELWKRIVRFNPLVDTVIVLDENREVVHFVSKLSRPILGNFRRLFLERIVPDMELHSLPAYTHKHLQKYYDDTPYLISYIRQRSGGRDFYIALNMNLPHITNDIFREEFHELQDRKFTVAVLDEAGRVVYGTPVESRSPLVFEGRFSSTLYLWRLQISPRELKIIQRQTKAQRTYSIVLVGIAVGVILVGILAMVMAMRKERRANQLKSEFISNVTHELKTPLTLIRMFGELLSLKKLEGEAVKEYAEIINRESDRLNRLIDNVLDFARIERGKAAYQFSPGNLATVVERGVDLCQYRAEQAGIKLLTNLEPQLPDTLLDEDAMTLLLMNLLENALKYGGDERGGEISVSLNRREDQLVLRVSDKGPGIPKEEHGRIFERFYRTHSARHKSVRGSGIGLSLVKHIAEAHGGGVRVESELGKGATFEVTIPMKAVTQDQVA